MKKRAKKGFIALMVLSVFLIASVGFGADVKMININTATAGELAQIKGIGPKLADKIVEYRKANGAFKKAEDIVNVPGIGPKLWEANKAILTVDSASAVPAPAVPAPAKGAKTQ
ncbi:MAG: helix-hairpin-helix domain-containing protein [Desulfatirhabdiaceae bacterium]